MPIDLGTGGLDLSTMILSRRVDTGDRSARFGIGIGIGLGLDFSNFTLLEWFDEISYRISYRDWQAMGFAEVASPPKRSRLPLGVMLSQPLDR
jgi:hypothetical protein